MKMINKNITVYVTNDGKEFDNQLLAEVHELSLEMIAEGAICNSPSGYECAEACRQAANYIIAKYTIRRRV